MRAPSELTTEGYLANPYEFCAVARTRTNVSKFKLYGEAINTLIGTRQVSRVGSDPLQSVASYYQAPVDV